MLVSLCYINNVACIVLMQVSSVTKMGDGDKVSVVTNTGVINDVDCFLWAIGRTPNIESLHLDRVVSVTRYVDTFMTCTFIVVPLSSMVLGGFSFGAYLLVD